MRAIKADGLGHLPDSAPSSVLISLGWNYAGSAVAMLLQLGYVACTGRIAHPDAFGSYAIAFTVTQFLGLFSNAGLATCVLRIDQLTSPAMRAAMRLGTASGIIFFLLTEAMAPWCGDLWHMPALTPMLRVLGFQLLVQSGASVTITALRRVGQSRAAVACELAGQVAGIVVSTTLLTYGRNPLGLAAAQPTAAAVTLALGTVVTLVRPLFPPGPSVRTCDLLASSSFLAGSSLLEFVTISAPVWVVGRLFGMDVTGAYSRASLMAGLTSQFLFQGLNSAVTPMLAERRKRGLARDRAVAHTVCSASAAAFICLGALAGVGPAALGLLLGSGWETASALVPVLALGSAMALVCRSGMIIDQVRRATGALIGTQLAVAATTAAGLAAAVAWHSLLLLAASAAMGQAVGHVVQLVCWHRAGLLHASVALRAHAVHGAVGSALGVAAALGAHGRQAVAAVACSLSSMLPVVLLCALLRAWIPLYTAVNAIGLQRPWKARRPATRSPGIEGLDTGATVTHMEGP
ncbi:MAG: hypothetical protein JWO67_6066 [Streptosporangiaceae bacterium]|nr:hypothetical protein [Streptosporangiaceae bacterium]